ncbi:hypothetical protein [Flexivirga oryzae]|uniref:Peptidase n=1 Tax=Flexivirga oryzae TaxID=1794944 RepID=A0A839NAN2_9MICO|nr:hypothetical protein [Flexivirga oryzae]MBB2893273.1 hypothetical protein [Flexivirga oryzae]
MLGRRQALGLAGVAAVSALTGCRASGVVARTSAGDTTAPRGTLAPSVIDRIADSFTPGPLATRRDLHALTSARSVLVGDIGVGELQACQLHADTSIRVIEKLTGIHLDQKYLVLLPRTSAEFDSWSHDRTADVAGDYCAPVDSSWQGWVVIKCAAAVGHGMTLLDDDDYLNSVIRHELFHANTLEDGDGGAPKWVLEGFAEWVASAIMIAFPTKPPPAVVPTDADFAHRPGSSYAQAFVFVAYLVDRFGQRSAIRFYKRATDASGGSTSHAFHAVFGATLASVTKDWAAQYKKQVAELVS